MEQFFLASQGIPMGPLLRAASLPVPEGVLCSANSKDNGLENMSRLITQTHSCRF